jgi:hypothetical protein
MLKGVLWFSSEAVLEVATGLQLYASLEGSTLLYAQEEARLCSFQFQSAVAAQMEIFELTSKLSLQSQPVRVQEFLEKGLSSMMCAVTQLLQIYNNTCSCAEYFSCSPLSACLIGSTLSWKNDGYDVECRYW